MALSGSSSPKSDVILKRCDYDSANCQTWCKSVVAPGLVLFLIYDYDLFYYKKNNAKEYVDNFRKTIKHLAEIILKLLQNEVTTIQI